MSATECVITVGNFDGVHVGHRALLQSALQIGKPVIAYTFRQHPLHAIAPGRVPPALCEPAEKESLLKAAGVSQVVWLDADASILGLDPEAFVQSVCRVHKPVAWVEGSNFRFGHNRAGDVQTLERLGRAMGFSVVVVPPCEVVLYDQSLVLVSSSLIRWLIAQGRVSDAAVCLGRAWTLRGRVEQGRQLGRSLNCPTANLQTGPQWLPSDGVYAGLAMLDGHPHPAAISIGVKPSLGGSQRTVEAHLLDWSGDLYGRTLCVQVNRWLREQFVFPDIQALKVQIARDVGRVRGLWESGMLLTPAPRLDP